MKITQSKDGKMRATVFVKFRVDIGMMVDAALAHNETYETGLPKTKLHWIKRLKSAIHSDGVNIWPRVEHVSKEARRPFEEAARKAFPKLQ